MLPQEPPFTHLPLFPEWVSNSSSTRYKSYFAMVAVVRNHYRAEDDAAELEARKSLTEVLAKLANPA